MNGHTATALHILKQAYQHEAGGSSLLSLVSMHEQGSLSLSEASRCGEMFLLLLWDAAAAPAAAVMGAMRHTRMCLMLQKQESTRTVPAQGKGYGYRVQSIRALDSAKVHIYYPEHRDQGS